MKLSIVLCFLFFLSLEESRGQSTSQESLSVTELKARRKVGLSASAAGSSGLVGVGFEIQFVPEVSWSAGVGAGGVFRSLFSEGRYYFVGKSFSTYLGAGVANWSSRSGRRPISETVPQFLVDRFLSEEERQSGRFSETLFYPAIGVQYMQLRGPWAGVGISVALLMLLDLDEMGSAPTATMGLSYYL